MYPIAQVAVGQNLQHTETYIVCERPTELVTVLRKITLRMNDGSVQEM